MEVTFENFYPYTGTPSLRDSSVSVVLKFLKSQPATQFSRSNNDRGDFWEILSADRHTLSSGFQRQCIAHLGAFALWSVWSVLYVSKETYTYDKRDVYMRQKRPINIVAHLGALAVGSVWVVFWPIKRALCIWQKRHIHMITETYIYVYNAHSSAHALHVSARFLLDLFDLCSDISKEIYAHDKRDLYTWQKRPIDIYQLTGALMRRMSRRFLIFLVCVLTWQKSPVHMTKETYAYDKRDLYLCI